MSKPALGLAVVAVLAVALFAYSKHPEKPVPTAVPDFKVASPAFLGINAKAMGDSGAALTPEQEELKKYAFEILKSNGGVADDLYYLYSLRSTGKRYVLLTFHPETTLWPRDTIVDLVDRKTLDEMGGYTFSTDKIAVYFQTDEIFYYELDAGEFRPLPGSKLPSGETYLTGDMMPAPKESHTDSTLTVMVFDLDEYDAAAQSQKQLREIVLSLPS